MGTLEACLQGMREVMGNQAILIASERGGGVFLGVGALLAFLPLYARRCCGGLERYLSRHSALGSAGHGHRPEASGWTTLEPYWAEAHDYNRS